jgi:orotidine-5'-phosphate decarboxylase
LKTTREWLLQLCASVAGMIIIPLDFDSPEKAIAMVDRMFAKGVKFFKVGLELIMTGEFASVVRHIIAIGGAVFLDGKISDIPNTVAGAVKSLVRLGVHMINMHCLSGLEAMKAAKKAAEEEAIALGLELRPLVIGVTVLTSLDYPALWRLGLFRANPEYMTKKAKIAALKSSVVKLALLAQIAGLDGVVASAQHVKAIKAACGSNFLVVTPGIRFSDGAVQDQKQVVTPGIAIADGSDFVVMGRPLTQPADGNIDAAVARAIREIEEGLEARRVA